MVGWGEYETLLGVSTLFGVSTEKAVREEYCILFSFEASFVGEFDQLLFIKTQTYISSLVVVVLHGAVYCLYIIYTIYCCLEKRRDLTILLAS